MHRCIEKTASGGARAGLAYGFTLIEMLAVLFILGILVTLIVGVSHYVMAEASRKETATTQAIVMEAIRTFYDETGDYPADSVDGQSLLSDLKGNAAAKDKLNNLPAGTLSKEGIAILDAYGKAMKYLASSGHGGKPVLISAGSDGKFGTDDDIRSDGQ